MDSNAVYAEIKQMLGSVPAFIKLIPKDEVEAEWNLFKHIELEEGVIPNKYRELIGVAISAATKCRYCALFHTEAAKLFGATDAEIEYAVRYAKNSAGWSTYLNGMQVDLANFKKEVSEIVTYVRSQQAGGGKKPGEQKTPTTRM
jgi:AhpD family alkylhydroperoxidase